MFGADLPPGEWSAMLIGGYWPSRGALDVLTVAAAGRLRSEEHLHGYADHLRSVSQAQLARQDGSTAEAARSLFARGEQRARATAERNAAKRKSYESAHDRVAALRDELSQLAADGNAAIRRIEESSAPLAAKVSSIVEVIADTQNLARTKTAESSGELLADVQRVLTAQGTEVSARAFAAMHGVDPAPPRPPALESLTQHVTARLDAPVDAAGGSPGGADPASCPTGAAASGPEQPGHSESGPMRTAGELAGSVAALTTGAGLLTAAGVAAGGTVGGSRADGADAPVGRATPSAAQVPVAATGTPAAGAPPNAAAPRSGATPVSPGLPVARRASGSLPLGNHPAPITSRRTGSPAGPHPSAGTSASVGAGLIRRTAAVVPGRSAEPATAGTTARADTQRLSRIVEAVAGQKPRLRWAAGERPDGTPVLVTDVAGGWIPPDVQIPVGSQLLTPRTRDGALAALLSDCTTVVTYTPGQPLPSQAAALTMSTGAREVAPVDDLGWKLARATEWRDGFPRLAHTLARAATAGTGWLESEAALLDEHVARAANRVVARYPVAVAGSDIDNWQLLATVAALVSGDRLAADYHFAWFTAGSPP